MRPDRKRLAHALETAELQFRLAAAVRLAASDGRQPRDLPIVWSHGNHSVRYEDIALTESDADRAAHFLLQTATFLLAAQIKDVLLACFRDPKNHRTKQVRAAYQIARLIRNAFAHRPFAPTWSIDKDCQDRVFTVPRVISIDTSGLHEQKTNWRDYGGPLALLLFARWARNRVLRIPPSTPGPVEQPDLKYYQVGKLLLRRIDGEKPEADT